MAKWGPTFFPSVHDSSLNAQGIFYTWRKFARNAQPEQKAPIDRLRWPPWIGEIHYDPLQFFCSSQTDTIVHPHPQERLMEQNIQLKEKELLAVMKDNTGSIWRQFGLDKNAQPKLKAPTGNIPHCPPGMGDTHYKPSRFFCPSQGGFFAYPDPHNQLCGPNIPPKENELLKNNTVPTYWLERKAQPEEMLTHWPLGIADIHYEPLTFFCPTQGDSNTHPDPEDELLEHNIQLKKKELLVLMEDDNETINTRPSKPRRKRRKSVLKLIQQ